MPLTDEQQINEDLKRLADNYPPQYLLGYSDFYEQRFLVNEHTLIPRPETEELVDRCLKENPNQQLTVVDVGTGTGAIALSLKLARPNWQVTAIDISEEALKVAKQNAQQLEAEVEFIHGDGLKPIQDKKIDILISNPPYIGEAEWALMDESVRTFEPKSALFADNDGLAIYQQLAQEAKQTLNPDGKIYLEIGFQQGEAVKHLFQQVFPKKQVQVAQDLSGNDRMVIVSSKKEEG
ncbi:protein-(glutamine-N5) methyltransferase, release factor-specific [Enterococcus moraviensis]|nr:protein-(glutamine-N5) methyltransferase, release factor-specific [Enterococcus moraviensis]